MAGSRKPNPTHITRYEREDHRGDQAERFSHYEHGVKVPAEHLEAIQRRGFVRVEETNADHWGRILDEHDDESPYQWSDVHRKHVERMAGEAGLAYVTTWTVGHIVWPGRENEVCRACPYGSAVLPEETKAVLHRDEIVFPQEVIDAIRGEEE